MALTDEHWDKIMCVAGCEAERRGLGTTEEKVLLFKEFWEVYSDEDQLDEIACCDELEGLKADMKQQKDHTKRIKELEEMMDGR